SGIADRTCICDAMTGRLIREFPAPAWSLAFSADGAMLASAGYEDRTIHVWDVAGGQERNHFKGHTNRVFSLAFTPDGGGLISASADTTALLWDLTGLRKEVRLPALQLTPEQRMEHWRALAGADAARAHRAIWTLAADPHSAAFLSKQM